MDTTHISFPQPNDTNELVWRYLDLPKFINLLSRRALYFARLDSMDDKREGTISFVDNLARAIDIGTTMPESHREQFSETLSLTTKTDILTAYINCWHLNQEESGAMWRLYNKDNQGVAIQTTYKKLTECIIDKHEHLYIGKIRYIDYYDESTGGHNQPLANFMCKHKAFQHENEVRILKWNTESYQFFETVNGWKLDIEKMRTANPPGIIIPVNLEKIIENIYVNGYAEEWYFETVKSVVEKFLPNAKVKWSSFKSGVYY